MNQEERKIKLSMNLTLRSALPCYLEVFLLIGLAFAVGSTVDEKVIIGTHLYYFFQVWFIILAFLPFRHFFNLGYYTEKPQSLKQL